MDSIAKCPYCGYENDLPKGIEILDMLEDESNNCNFECEECEEEFVIHVEFNPTYHVSKMLSCEYCENKTEKLKNKNNTSLFPKKLKDFNVCLDCYGEHMRNELNDK